jgi:HKD family nuclease
MEIALLEAKAISRRLKTLIENHDRISLAVAWGELTGVAKTLIANKSKFDTVLFGLDFSATDPDLIDELVGVPNAYVAKNRPGCFHPKIFYFQSRSKAEAIVGSANFTNGGLGKNLEASVHVKGVADEPFFKQVRKQLGSYKCLHRPITKKLAASYRRQANVASKAQRPKNPVLPDDEDQWPRFNSRLATMSWEEFVRRARRDKHHDFDKRIDLVREIQTMFARKGSFADLSLAEWKGVAGLLGAVEATAANLGGLEWGWFGSMKRATAFAKAIGLQDSAIAQAVDLIPKRGDITLPQFDQYAATFKRALPQSKAGNPIGTATRLLALKRPDFFVCVDGGNKPRLAKALDFPPNMLTLDNYWAWVIEPIRQAPWYNAPRPVGPDTELWDARVAMLDAIYYAPQKKRSVTSATSKS